MTPPDSPVPLSSSASPVPQSSEQSTAAKAPAFVRSAETTPRTNASQPWAIRMHEIGKQYKLGQARGVNDNFREDVMKFFSSLGGKTRGAKSKANSTFWALQHINLEINRGDTVGIIGRNGAGKSTLLKVLSRITSPTTGEMRYRGRLASLLEVGTGFHRELSGRENIYLNGSILGMRRAEIRQHFDAIVDFAGVEKFLDTPVKFYSSGMYVRLAFAVAAHLRTDILVVDEVLAVGDAEFQKKCLGKMQDVAHDGRTVLFVSHNMGAVESICRRGIVLQSGNVLVDSTVPEAIERYSSSSNPEGVDEKDFQKRLRETGKQACGVLLNAKTLVDGKPSAVASLGKELVFEVEFDASNHKGIKIGIGVNDFLGQRIVSFSPTFQAPTLLAAAEGKCVARCRIPSLSLAAGLYSISVACEDRTGPLEALGDALILEVVSSDFYGTGILPSQRQGIYLEEAEWELETKLGSQK